MFLYANVPSSKESKWSTLETFEFETFKKLSFVSLLPAMGD